MALSIAPGLRSLKSPDARWFRREELRRRGRGGKGGVREVEAFGVEMDSWWARSPGPESMETAPRAAECDANQGSARILSWREPVYRSRGAAGRFGSAGGRGGA